MISSCIFSQRTEAYYVENSGHYLMKTSILIMNPSSKNGKAQKNWKFFTEFESIVINRFAIFSILKLSEFLHCLGFLRLIKIHYACRICAFGSCPFCYHRYGLCYSFFHSFFLLSHVMKISYHTKRGKNRSCKKP